MNASSRREAILTGVSYPLRASAALLSAILSLYSCATPAPVPGKACRTTAGIPGPEDFDVDTSFRPPRLLISSQDRRDHDPNGEFVKPGVIFQLSPARELVGTPQPLPFADRDGLPFHPHGIAFAVLGGVPLLYVINHAMFNHHLIEVFAVKPGELKLLRRLRSPLLISPNDLVALPNGDLYVTNDHGSTGNGFARQVEDVLARPWSSVVMYNAASSKWSVVADGIAFANGIAVSPSGDSLYVGSSRDRGIFVYKRTPSTGELSPRPDFIDLHSGADNLMWEKPGILDIAAHPSAIAFLGHMRSSENLSPSEIFRLNTESRVAERIYSNDGKQISGSSTGLVWNGMLIVGQVFEPFLLTCNAD